MQTPPINTWFAVTRGAGKVIDELDVNCDSWGVKFTDFRLSDATGFHPFTNVSPYLCGWRQSTGQRLQRRHGGPALEDYPVGGRLLASRARRSISRPAPTRGMSLPANSGNAQGWITYSAYPGQEQQAVH